jgi:tetratricopeptide (TPR) repeat protein
MIFSPLRTLILSALLTAGCAGASTNIQENLRAGEEAFGRGEVLEAYRLLRDPTLMQGKPSPRYSALLKQVTQATEYLIERWLEKGDFWLAQGNFAKALSYYRDITEQLPPNDPFRAKLMEKTRELESRIEGVRKEVEALVEEGLEDFTASRYRQAKEKLVEARWKAVEHNLPFTMRYQRLIEECQRRLPENLDVVAGVEVELGEDDGADRLKRKPRRRKAVPKLKPPVKTDEEEIYRGMLRRGHRYQAAKKYLEAVLTYRKVLEMYPEQSEAARALEKLEPARQRLVTQELKKAGEYFAKEDLEKAAPHYQRVLLLDPGNIRAQEGLQMYRRLKELKKKQK